MNPIDLMAHAAPAAVLQVFQLTRAALLLVWDDEAAAQRTRRVPMNGRAAFRTRFITKRLTGTGQGGRNLLALVHHGVPLDPAGLAVSDIEGRVIAREEDPWRGEPAPFDAACLLAGLDAAQRIECARFLLASCPTILQISHDTDYLACCRELLSALQLKAKPLAARARVLDGAILCECVTPKRLGERLSAVAVGEKAIATPVGAPVACADPSLPAGFQRVAVLLAAGGDSTAPTSLLIFGNGTLVWRRGVIDSAAVPTALDWLARPVRPSRAARWCLFAGLAQMANEVPAAQRLMHEMQVLMPPPAPTSVAPSPALAAGITQSIATPAGLLVHAWLNDPHQLVGAIESFSLVGRQQRPIGDVPLLPPPAGAAAGTRGLAVFFPAQTGSKPNAPCQINIVLRSGHTIEIGEGPGPLTGAAALDAVLATPLQAGSVTEPVYACVEPAARALITSRKPAMEPATVRTFGTLPKQPRAAVIIPVADAPSLIAGHAALFATMPDRDSVEVVYVVGGPEREAEIAARLADLRACHGGALRLVVMPPDATGAHGLNAAARLVAAPVLTFLASAVVPESAAWLDTLVHALAAEPRRQLVGAPTLYHDGSIAAAGAEAEFDAFERWQIRNRYAGFPRNYPALAAAAPARIASTGCLALSAALFAEVGGFAHDYLGTFHRDADISARVWNAGGTVAVAAEPFLVVSGPDYPEPAGGTPFAAALDSRLFEARWRSLLDGLMAPRPPAKSPRPAKTADKVRPRPSRANKRAA